MRKAFTRLALATLTITSLAIVVYVAHAAQRGVLFVAGTETVRPADSITVEDQAVVEGMIVAHQVVANQDGWVTAHTLQSNSKPILNQIVGTTAIQAGTHQNVRININEGFASGDTVLLMLHVDKGTKNVLEFPSGSDTLVQIDGRPVTTSFSVLTGTGQPTSMIPAAGLNRLSIGWYVILACLLILAGWRVRRYGRPRSLVHQRA
jgi:hypothetical protein